MIIDDLNYLEVIAENTSCVGGSGSDSLFYIPPIAQADAAALADALGYITETKTLTKTVGVAGLFSSSVSLSSSYAVG